MMIEIPGLGASDKLPAGDAQAKVVAWLELLRRDPMVNTAINMARMMGAGGVLEELETATSAQIEQGIADVVAQLQRLRGDVEIIDVNANPDCSSCNQVQATWWYNVSAKRGAEVGDRIDELVPYCSHHGPNTPADVEAA